MASSSSANATATATKKLSSANATETKKLLLVSSDSETFEVEEAIAVQSETIKNIIEDGCDNGKVPLPNVKANALAKVIEYCKEHVKDNNDSLEFADSKKEKEEFDKKYADGVEDNQELLFDLILAANYLDIKGLLDLLCKKVADMMKGKTPEQIREKFHIKNDFTPEEEEEIRRENAWAFE